jgi:F-type H+-transporting ATPase subunit delta
MKRIASRYSTSLLQLAAEEGVLERVHNDMLCLDQVCTDNKVLVSALRNPLIKHDKKLAVLQAIFRNTVHALTLRFFAMVAQKCREAVLPAMTRAFLAQYDQYQGIEKAQVTTAFALSDQTISQFQKIVQQISPCQQVILEQSVNPTLIGGYVLRIGDKRLDQSLRKKLLILQKNCVTTMY